jgi:hypothetical protein
MANIEGMHFQGVSAIPASEQVAMYRNIEMQSFVVGLPEDLSDSDIDPAKQRLILEEAIEEFTGTAVTVEGRFQLDDELEQTVREIVGGIGASALHVIRVGRYSSQPDMRPHALEPRSVSEAQAA